MWLIRHGESEANTGMVTSDPASVSLTARGYEQAKCVAGHFTSPPSLLVTSPYLRTKQTAEATLQRFPHIPQEEWAIQEITYLSPSRYRNTSFQERKPAANAYWELADPYHQDGEDSESISQYMARIRFFIERLKTLEGTFAAVFTHETVIQTVLWMALNHSLDLNSDNMRAFRAFTLSFRFPNCAILQLEFRGDDLWFSHVTSHLL